MPAIVAILKLGCLFLLAMPMSTAQEWSVGLSKVDITPREAIWMAGYGGRKHPSEGSLHPLWVKAMALRDPGGRRAVLVTMDLIGIGRELSVGVRDELRERFGLERSQVVLAVSHTHSGPVVGRNLELAFFLNDEQARVVAEYAQRLRKCICSAVEQALADMRPCKLSWGVGNATFAVNRRNNPERDVPQLRERGELKGPVDHDVPVLAVRSGEGELLAAVMGYACHATVLKEYHLCGDYPGFAQVELEARHPGCQAMFWAGCGGDQNPLPRRKLELAREYGKQLAAAVDAVLRSEMRALSPSLGTAYVEVDLPFAKLPTREELEAETHTKDRYFARRARVLLAQLDRGEAFAESYPYPIEVWKLGQQIDWVFLGGEVVVDIGLRLEKELAPRTAWVTAYTNDVMAYIPSKRVHGEGGYEVRESLKFYGLPSVWSPRVEEILVAKVHALLQR